MMSRGAKAKEKKRYRLTAVAGMIFTQILEDDMLLDGEQVAVSDLVT
jgi:hypothetical protein